MEINLFCFPFAGGSKYSYQEYLKYTNNCVKIISVEYPGRGTRIRESLLKDIEDIVEDVYSKIKDELSQPYAFYGHSMGSIIAYLLTKKIIENGDSLPVHLFLTGRGGPSAIFSDSPKYLLPENEFITELNKMGGSSDEVLNNKELMSFFEPIIRADFQALETYRYKETLPFDIPVSVMIGQEENIVFGDAQTWQKETTKEIDIKVFPGNHFFINDYPAEIMQIILEKLSA
ncbi:hypothetical protein TH53_23730 [Pedobacter lusitanus]|uniref:Thioesterase domain-containing protein n=1 Tax=Pedobacter lusitanus TaxID=1503925 RepID=A0A0D0GC76_9SPHI|nr:thioesterase domain-containing protein [Pedobacter lusitanus]KIO74897.1 hypothetical protein TH53_23730 [Pedobacter lusitanus]